MRKSSHRILVVGDNSPTREVLKSVLFAAGERRLAVATSASEALDHLGSNTCDVALIDCNQVDEGWLALVRRLKTSGRTRQLPVLVLTGRHEPETLQAARDAGVDGILVKPVAPGALKRRLTAMFRARDYVMLDGFPA